MSSKRIQQHPILPIPEKEWIPFYWNGQKMEAQQGEVISSALFANGIQVFGHHAKDDSAQGIYCANGQCAQCTVIANGLAVKACMTPVQKNMIVESCEGLPELPLVEETPRLTSPREMETDVLIIGGGPAGLSAARELGKLNIPTILVDDKDRLGGKLVLQTHKFFGSMEDCYAGTRGIHIGEQLATEIEAFDSVDVWLNTYALYVFSDQKVGLVQNQEYILVQPKIILVAAGAREKTLAFKGNTLPGVYGAGAFQTLVNRDLVKPSERLFIVGGGNVGLIAGYHALQAGIDVVGLVEGMKQCGGYKVHADKLKRLGVPIYTSHTVLSANGDEKVESVTVAEIDENFQPILGTEKTFACDTLLIAVGLNPVNEFVEEARQVGMKVFAAGDALEIAEASSAMFNGKISGLKIAQELGYQMEIPEEWNAKAEVLKSHPGDIVPLTIPDREEGVFPIINCVQEIPCNPCTTICSKGGIVIEKKGLMGVPQFVGDCTGCHQCILICPGLAITLVDYRQDQDYPIVSLPYEVHNKAVVEGDDVVCVDIDGQVVGNFEVIKVMKAKTFNKAHILKIKAPKDIAKKIAGIRVQDPEITQSLPDPIVEPMDDDVIICRCERVTAGEIRAAIREGVRDLNQLKNITRAQMGACGGKTCETLIYRLFREEGVSLEEVTANTRRPVFVEVPLGTFANEGSEE